jgi:hypothetical protein
MAATAGCALLAFNLDVVRGLKAAPISSREHVSTNQNH